MWRFCGGSGCTQDLEQQLQKHEIIGNVRKAVFIALKRASADDPILVVFWNEQRLAKLNAVDPNQSKAHLLNTINASPGVSSTPPAPTEVFNIRNAVDLDTLRTSIQLQHPWCRGACGIMPPFPEATGRALIITDAKRSPGIYIYPLFGV